MKLVDTPMTEKDPDLSEMPTNVDFSDKAKPAVGKYANRLSGDVRLVLLDPDVAVRFPSADAVNKALRSIISSPDASANG